MKKTMLLLSLLSALLNAPFSHAMSFVEYLKNPAETKKHIEQIREYTKYIANTKRHIVHRKECIERNYWGIKYEYFSPNGRINYLGITALQEALMLQAAEPKAEAFAAEYVEKILSLGADPNIINPLTGGTALFDRVKHHHKNSADNNFVHNIKYLIDCGARLDSIDSQNNNFYNLVEQARTSDRITQEEYDEIHAIPEVQAHVRDLAQHLSDVLEDLLPVQSLHSIVTDYTYGVPH